MTKDFSNLLFAVLLAFTVSGCTTNDWQLDDMDSGRRRMLRVDVNSDSQLCGFLSECQFELHYFFGKDYTPNQDPNAKDRKTILYIPGGPGEIVDRDLPALDFLSREYNVVYFDVRGTGLSQMPLSNAYDRYLRAKYVVEDIEALRRKIFEDECAKGESRRETGCREGVRQWDAIYAHSWGTIVAQIYAWKYKTHVNKLILSAPVSRGHAETASARRQMIVDNLTSIFENQRSKECAWPDDKTLEKIFFKRPGDEIEDFCFVDEEQRTKIQSTLSTILNELEKYGSLTFVTEFYKQINEDAVMRQHFQQKFPYPQEFFKALRQVEIMGGGEIKPLRFDPDLVMRPKMNAAFFLGYYLTLPPEALSDQTHRMHPDTKTKPCHNEAPFWDNLPKREDNLLKRFFCKRITDAGDEIRLERSRTEISSRARVVYGVFDGLARWIFELMENEGRLNERGCFQGKDLLNLASGDVLTETLKNNTVAQSQAGKIGRSRFEEICPWDPARYAHGVQTMILASDSDPVTAGAQADYLFERGLEQSKRILFKFPGAGHSMSLQVKPSEGEETNSATVRTATERHLKALINRFISLSINEFLKAPNVQPAISAFGARIRVDWNGPISLPREITE